MRIELLPTTRTDIRRSLVFEQDQHPIEVIESSVGVEPLPPRGGIFAPWSGDAFRLVLGPPLARGLASLAPPLDPLLGLVDRVLNDLTLVHDVGARHGALELAGWGLQADGAFAVRASVEHRAPDGHPQESDVQAIGAIVAALAPDQPRLRYWLRGTGALTGQVTFGARARPDRRCSRSLAVAA